MPHQHEPHGLDQALQELRAATGMVGWSKLYQKRQREGVEVEELVIRCYVVKKLLLSQVSPRIPIPKEIMGVPTDVVEVLGPPRPSLLCWNTPSLVWKTRAALGSLGKPPVLTHSTSALGVPEGAYVGRTRPIKGGWSLGHEMLLGAGTLGCFGWKDGFPCIVSNNHVMALISSLQHPRAKRYDLVLQPGWVDFDGLALGRYANGVAFLGGWVPLDEDQSVKNHVDLAWAYLTNDVADIYRGFSPTVERIGQVRGRIRPEPGMPVEKIGRTSGHTTGTVTDASATVFVDYGTFVAQMDDIFQTTALLERGDSGSAVFKQGTGELLGLAFSQSGPTSWHCKQEHFPEDLLILGGL